MKRIALLTAALAMLLAFALSAAAETVTVDEAILGTWIMAEVEAEFTFHDDGTYDVSFPGVMEGSGTYSTRDGQIVLDSEAPIAYVIEEDSMTFKDSGMDIVFTRKTVDFPAELIGTWSDPDNPRMIVFSDDGAYTTYSNGELKTGTYTVTDNIIRYVLDDSEGECAYIVSGNILLITESGEETYYLRYQR